MTSTLLQKCEGYLVDKHFGENVPFGNMDMYLELANDGVRYQFKELLERSSRSLSKFSSVALEKNINFNELPSDIKTNIFENRMKNLESAMNTFFYFSNTRYRCERCSEHCDDPGEHWAIDETVWSCGNQLSTVCPDCNVTVFNVVEEFQKVKSKFIDCKRE